jgi:hypothetical protein
VRNDLRHVHQKQLLLLLVGDCSLAQTRVQYPRKPTKHYKGKAVMSPRKPKIIFLLDFITSSQPGRWARAPAQINCIYKTGKFTKWDRKTFPPEPLSAGSSSLAAFCGPDIL